MNTPSHSRLAFTLFVLFGINTLNFFDRQILPAVQEKISEEWSLKDTHLGWLGTAFILLYALVGLPLGRLADVSSRRWLLVGGVTLWSALTAASGLAWNFWSLFVCRLGVGVGEATCAPAGNSLIGELFPKEARARATAVFMIGLPLGLALSFVVSATVAARYGWQASFLVAGLPGLLLGIAAIFIVDPRSTTGHGAASGSWLDGVRSVLSQPVMWWLILSGAVHNFNMYAFGQFLSSFLKRYHYLTLEQAGWLSGLIYGCGALGIFLGGWLGDRVVRGGPAARLMVPCKASAAAVLPIVAALLVERGYPWLCALPMLVGCGLFYFYYGTVYAAIQDLYPANQRGLAMSTYFCGMYLLGAVWGPAATGWLSDFFAVRAARLAGVYVDLSLPLAKALPDDYRAVGLQQALFIVPILATILAVILWMAARQLRRDELAQRASEGAAA